MNENDLIRQLELDELRRPGALDDVVMARTRPFPQAKLVIEGNWNPRQGVPYMCPNGNGPSRGGAVRS